MSIFIRPWRVERRFQICAWAWTGLSSLSLFLYLLVSAIFIIRRTNTEIEEELTSSWGRFPDILLCPDDAPTTFAFAGVYIESESKSRLLGPTLTNTNREARASDINISVRNGCLEFAMSVMTPNFKGAWDNWMILSASFNQSLGPDERDAWNDLQLIFRSGEGESLPTDDYWKDKFEVALLTPYPVVGSVGSIRGFYITKHLEVWRSLLGGEQSYTQFAGQLRDAAEVQRPVCPWIPLSDWARANEPCTPALKAISLSITVTQSVVPAMIHESKALEVFGLVRHLGGYLSIFGLISVALFTKKNKSSRVVQVYDEMTLRGHTLLDALGARGASSGEGEDLTESESDATAAPAGAA